MGRLFAALLPVIMLGLVACSPESRPRPSPTPAATTANTTPGGQSTRAEDPTTPSPTPEPRSTPAPKPDPISVEALIQRTYDGGNLRRRGLIADYGAYQRYRITFRSEGLRISGVMNVPDGRGPFPVLVLAHGYIEPSTYFAGQGMPREHDYLARQGYVVLHVDYRGHAGSDADPGGQDQVDYEQRLPYAVDVINAGLAVRRSTLPFIDPERVGVFGRSMGGAVTLTAITVRPEVFDAAVVHASTSSLVADNWRQFGRDAEDNRRGVNRRIERGYGLPKDDPAFWRGMSPRDRFDRVTIPVRLHHGELDDTCPIRWSEATTAALERAGKDVRLFRYGSEGHTFAGGWTRAIERTTAFFDRELR